MSWRILGVTRVESDDGDTLMFVVRKGSVIRPVEAHTLDERRARTRLEEVLEAGDPPGVLVFEVPVEEGDRVRFVGPPGDEDDPGPGELGTVVAVNPYDGSVVVSWGVASALVHAHPEIDLETAD